jgi:hypothetical protein
MRDGRRYRFDPWKTQGHQASSSEAKGKKYASICSILEYMVDSLLEYVQIDLVS